MATYQILSWNGLPAGVRVVEGKKKINKHLPPRFQTAIDAAAMSTGLTNEADYMAGWQYSAPVERSENGEELADLMVEKLIAEYSPKKLKALRVDVEKQLNERSQ